MQPVIKTAVSAQETYRPYLRRWQLAAGWWLLTWYFLAVGGALGATLIAANPTFLRSGGDFKAAGLVVAWFVVGATLMTNFLRPWRFHRGYQRATYRMQAALDRARLDPTLERDLPGIVDECHALILAAGNELDRTDGLPGAQPAASGGLAK